MPRFEKGNKFGNRFTSENQPANKGRKPKIYEVAKGTYKIQYDDFRNIVMELMQMTLKELKAVTNDENRMAWVVNIARAMIKDASMGRINTLSEMADRFYGKAKQTVETESKVEVKAAIDVDLIPDHILTDFADKMQEHIYQKKKS